MECWYLQGKGEFEKAFTSRRGATGFWFVVMERLQLQGPINPCFLGEHLEAECFGRESVVDGEEGVRFQEEEEEEDEARLSILSLEDKMPFLQMLQSVETPQLFCFKEPNFQTLLRLQHLKKPFEINVGNSYSCSPEMDHNQTHQVQPLELESCVTHEILELHSPSPVKSETKELSEQHQNCRFEGVVEQPISSLPVNQQTQSMKSPAGVTRERRKRKRTRPAKNKEEVENQRMTHIAVERNRRRQMNEHLNSLRVLMPPSYIQRGDQASIIGGAIDFVRELEQLLQTLEAQKRMKTSVEQIGNDLLTSPESAMEACQKMECGIGSDNGEKINSGAAEIEVNLIQNYVNLKIHCPRRPGQLLQAIATLESLRLTVLHLNITSSQASVFYSFNIKMEEECKVRSAEEIGAAVHQIFS